MLLSINYSFFVVILVSIKTRTFFIIMHDEDP